MDQKLKSLAMGTVKGDQSSPMASEVSGKTFTMESNDRSINTISFNFDTSPVQIKITTHKDEYLLTVGYQESELSELPTPPLVSDKVAVSGAWEDTNTYTARFIYYETPQSTNFTFKFKENKLIWDTENKASFGPKNPLQMTGIAQ